ncbi:MAG TPA: ROK family protein [Leptospiraceae bacterium]|nr:ROK family protein [Leptospirales bacterium]HMU84808.1 ROK family protein [Leptospiraceae bacterium]HMX58464.1 ROK family protein [Leptospiraceae bacterium]HNJ05360.1 ROK family protein [Leptospiraceae bacterium]HNN74242.1 ROK family protein [Leptospiraceae bacterium]
MHRIGVDLGGTKAESILLSGSGQELFRKRIPTRREEGYEAILSDLTALVQETAVAGKLDLNECTVGIGIPGIIDQDGRVVNANTTCLIGHAFESDLARNLNHPVLMMNDANCFTMAECTSGAGQGYDFVFGVILGTGCGGGISIGGKVRRGLHGIAGEWGHVSVDPDGTMCYSGIKGCIESRISGSGVEKRFADLTGQKKLLKDIVIGMREGDPVCQEHMEFFFEEFGRCMAVIINILDPDAIVLGGGVSQIPELYTIGVERIKKYTFYKNPKTPVLQNKLGDSAGVFGAAWIGI